MYFIFTLSITEHYIDYSCIDAIYIYIEFLNFNAINMLQEMKQTFFRIKIQFSKNKDRFWSSVITKDSTAAKIQL